MNKLVQELITKAGTDVSGKWLSLDHAEKLIKIVVQECATIADKNSPLSYPDHGIKIKRHFGVE
jgi:hypothetical protein